MTNEVQTIEHEEGQAPAPAKAQALTPMEMLSNAVERGADIETLSKLMDLAERWEKNQARRAFDEAMAAAKAEIPVIGKTRKVSYDQRGGGHTEYMHEDLATIVEVVTPILAKHGLSFRFRTPPRKPDEPITVICVISHRDGHMEENALSAAPDTSGQKNSIQAIGSTITYLQRYTLKAALGLAAAADDDAQSAEPADLISDEQFVQLKELIEWAEADEGKVCNRFGVERLADLRAIQYAHVEAALKKFGTDHGKASS
jgi:hypothetical protein